LTLVVLGRGEKGTWRGGAALYHFNGGKGGEGVRGRKALTGACSLNFNFEKERERREGFGLGPSLRGKKRKGEAVRALSLSTIKERKEKKEEKNVEACASGLPIFPGGKRKKRRSYHRGPLRSSNCPFQKEKDRGVMQPAFVIFIFSRRGERKWKERHE